MNISHRASSLGRFATAVVAALILGLISPIATAATPVLDEIPSDALVVLKVNHLQDTSTKLAALMQALGVTDFAPAMADPLTAAENQSGITEGVDKTGDFAVAWLNIPYAPMDGGANAAQADKPPVVMFLPVSDYKAFLGNTTVASTDGDISTVHFKNQDANAPETYVVNWGDYAVMSPFKDALAKKPDGMKLTGAAATALAEKDAAIYINMPSVKAKLLPMLADNREKILDQAAKTLSGGDDTKAAPIRAIVNQALDVVQGLVQDAQSVTVGTVIAKTGVNSTTTVEFAPDSHWGKIMAQVPNTDKPLLGGLPSEKYLFFGGGIQDPKLVAQVFDDVLGPMAKPLADLGDEGKIIQTTIDSYKEMFSTIESSVFGMIAPSGPIGQTGLFQFVTVYKADAPKLLAAQINQFKSQQDMMKALGMQGADMVKTSVTENSKTVDGVQFDLLSTQFNMQANTPQAMQVNQMMGIMYGPNGFNMYSGVVDPTTLLVVAGGPDQLMTDAVAAAKSGADVLSDAAALKAVDAELPKSRTSEFYIPLDVIVSTGVGYARQFGFPMPVQIPPNLAPIGVTFGTDASAVRIDSHVPTELVQSLIQAGMAVYLQMHNGQNGGGGGAGGL